MPTRDPAALQPLRGARLHIVGKLSSRFTREERYHLETDNLGDRRQVPMRTLTRSGAIRRGWANRPEWVEP